MQGLCCYEKCAPTQERQPHHRRRIVYALRAPAGQRAATAPWAAQFSSCCLSRCSFSFLGSTTHTHERARARAKAIIIIPCARLSLSSLHRTLPDAHAACCERERALALHAPLFAGPGNRHRLDFCFLRYQIRQKRNRTNHFVAPLRPLPCLVCVQSVRVCPSLPPWACMEKGGLL